VLLTIVLIPVFLGVLFTGFRVLRADDGRWMPSGRVLQGLGSEYRKETNTTAQANQWMAEVRESSWAFIVIHHSASRSGSVESIHREHSERKDGNGNRWLGIGYHFVIGNGHGMGDGKIEATFRWNEQIHGAHSGNAMFNARGIGICLIGNFEDHPPTPKQVKAVRELVKTLAVRHQISRSKVMGHGDVKATACPGKHFPLKELRAVIPENREG
jgi:N-acetyl-anhydromuramyl-L-alanine amidase AmpD